MRLVFLIISFYIFPLDFTHSQSGWISQKIGNKQFVDINLINNSTGFIIGYDSIILKTTNTGNNWQTIRTNIPVSNGGIICGYFNNINRGMIGSLGGVYRTSNGGLTWVFSSVPSIGLSAISMCRFTDSLTGYACGWDAYPFPMISGYDGVLWKSKDGGITWFELLRIGASDFREFYFLNEDSMSVLGNTSLYFTFNGGTNWVSRSFFSTPFIDGGSFTNPFIDTILICGNYGGIVRTTNNGFNWHTILARTESGNLNKLFFITKIKGFAIGDTGKIFYTSNAGINWITQNISTNKNLKSVWFINKDTGFIVGDSGIILKTFTGGLVNFKSISSQIPNNFYLEQNYPNPFNPITNIQYDIPFDNFVTIKIYDITGKVVKTLINDFKKAGSHLISFNAENLSSGIYFYRIDAGNFSDSKRMILIK